MCTKNAKFLEVSLPVKILTFLYPKISKKCPKKFRSRPALFNKQFKNFISNEQ